MSRESSAATNDTIAPSIGDDVSDPSALTAAMCRELAALEEAEENYLRLKKEHMSFISEQKMKCDAQIVWNGLPRAEREKKTHMLAALRSERVPQVMEWYLFNKVFSRKLQNDRDIFLARLDLDGFEETYLFDEFVVPPHFRNDREVMLKICSKNSMSLRWASRELQNDYDIVMAAVTHRFHFAPLALEYASTKLKGNKRLARVVLARGHGIRAFKYLSDRLQEDYNLAMLAIVSTSEDYCRQFEHLRELPEEMLEDHEIVLAAVTKRSSNLRFVKDQNILEDPEIIRAACENDGLALQYVSENSDFLSRNYDIVRTACMNNGSAIRFCPKRFRAQLMKDSDFVMAALATADCCEDVYRRLPASHRVDTAYLLAACENGLELPTHTLTEAYKHDRPLFMRILCRSVCPFRLYKKLPVEITAADPEIGLAVLNNDSVLAENYLAKSLVGNVPRILLREYTTQLLRGVISEDSNMFPEEVRNNKKLAMAICKADSSFYSLVALPLRSDMDVVKATLSDCHVSFETILSIPKDIAQQSPEVLALAIDACPGCESSDSPYKMAQRFLCRFGRGILNHKSVFLAFLRKHWPSHHIRAGTPGLRALCDKYDVMLEVLKNCDGAQDTIADVYTTFDAFSWDNTEFLKQAVQLQPYVFRFAISTGYGDFDYMVTAVSSNRKTLFYLEHDDPTIAMLLQFSKDVRSTLSVIDGFYVLLCGISIVKEPPSKRSRRRVKKKPASCHLPMLEFGLETGVAVKRLIADYAGVPLGPNTKLLRPALENLRFWGY